MQLGDFSEIAKFYHNRPSYSKALINYILKVCELKNNLNIVEIGAGTGKLTSILKELAPNSNIKAIEPNLQMRQIGENSVKDVQWLEGSAENTSLDDNTADIVFMASSFHWSDRTKSLKEFKRILEKGGYFCALWNPRMIEEGTIFDKIEKEIKTILPNLNRVSSGIQNTKNWQEIIQSTGDFAECVYLCMPHFETMSKERYIGAWKSVNDIQAQAGEKWEEILKMIENKLGNIQSLTAKYLIKAYLAKSTK